MNKSGYSISWKRMKKQFPREYRIATLVQYSIAKYNGRLLRLLNFNNKKCFLLAISIKLNNYGFETKNKGEQHISNTLRQGATHFEWLVTKTPEKEINGWKPRKNDIENFNYYETIDFKSVLDEISLFLKKPEEYLKGE